MNNTGVQVAATVWLHACFSQQLWTGEIFQEEYNWMAWSKRDVSDFFG